MSSAPAGQGQPQPRDESARPARACPECAEHEHKMAQLLGRLGGSERARHHLEQENRRLALDLYRATARAPLTEKPT